MKSLTFISDKEFTIENIKQLFVENEDYRISLNDDELLINDNFNSYINVRFDNLLEQYEEDELILIPFAKPYFLTLVFNANEFFNKMLLILIYDLDMYYDDDKGKIESIVHLLKTIKENPKLKWYS